MEEIKNTEVNEEKVENVQLEPERKDVVEVKRGDIIVQKLEDEIKVAEKELEDVEKELNDAEDELRQIFNGNGKSN